MKNYLQKMYIIYLNHVHPFKTVADNSLRLLRGNYHSYNLVHQTLSAYLVYDANTLFYINMTNNMAIYLFKIQILPRED